MGWESKSVKLAITDSTRGEGSRPYVVGFASEMIRPIALFPKPEAFSLSATITEWSVTIRRALREREKEREKEKDHELDALCEYETIAMKASRTTKNRATKNDRNLQIEIH